MKIEVTYSNGWYMATWVNEHGDRVRVEARSFDDLMFKVHGMTGCHIHFSLEATK